MENKISRADLRALFFSQIKDLVKMGYSETIIDELKSKESVLLDCAEKIDFSEGHIPFIPVVPERILSYRDQASLISSMPHLGRTLDVRGQRHHLLAKLDKTYAPNYSENPYYIIDIALAPDSELDCFRKINHEEGFAIAGFKQELIAGGTSIAATACTWEGYETCLIHLAILEPGYGEYYIAADWELASFCNDLLYGFCRSRLI